MKNEQHHHPCHDYLSALREADRKGLEEIYEAFFPMILGLIRRNNGSAEDADDTFQTALLVIYKKSQDPGFKITCKFSTFLYKVCKIVWWNELKMKDKKKRHLWTDTEEFVEIPDLEFEEIARQALFEKAFNKLGDSCQKLLLLFFEGLPMEVIKERMNYGSAAYTRRRKHVCKEKLIEIIKKMPGFKELRNL